MFTGNRNVLVRAYEDAHQWLRAVKREASVLYLVMLMYIVLLIICMSGCFYAINELKR